ncbi:AMP-binding protein [Umezawaea sp. Da 62-37]|uniref:AMP-binding protein n=1 Tax=Umezawaea sp. Da 62-37 TaxID=3075927 RepID=UPI0028F6F151|nr:AMP-binding protein [Umezawaea sp. Da 62-37]WNV86213.1 AMP-binding protein [Umezawaea sp. Da 62-37]
MTVSRSRIVPALLEHAGSRPSAPALLWRGTRVGYGELAAMTRSAAAAVAGLPPGPVGVVAEKTPETIALVLGCLAAGRRVLLPAPALPVPTLSGLYERAGCVAVVAVPGGTSNAARLTTVVVDVHANPAHDAEPGRDGDPEADGTAFLLTTSGSTGAPKIVPLTSAAVDRFALWADGEFDLGPGRRVLNYAPLNFDLCLLEVWGTVRAGGCVVLADPDRATDGAALLDLLVGQDVHVVQAVPLFYELLAAVPGARVDGVDRVVVTGDAFRPDRLPALRALFPNARIDNVYGCTETNDSFIHELGSDLSEIPIGTPLPGVRALLVHEDGTVLHGPGVGELLVSTPFQTPGYLDSPNRFVPHPDGADDLRYFRSGDLVRRTAAGALVVEGRIDFRVKVRGQQVDTQQVEQVLLDHTGVLEAAAVAVPDQRAGNRLHVVVRTDGTVNSLVLRRHCAERLPPAAVPSTLRITEDPLPRTSTGKVDRKHITTTMELVI